MEQEFSALLGNHTRELVPPTPNQPVINRKWILHVKYNADGSLDHLQQWNKNWNLDDNKKKGLSSSGAIRGAKGLLLISNKLYLGKYS